MGFAWAAQLLFLAISMPWMKRTEFAASHAMASLALFTFFAGLEVGKGPQFQHFAPAPSFEGWEAASSHAAFVAALATEAELRTAPEWHERFLAHGGDAARHGSELRTLQLRALGEHFPAEALRADPLGALAALRAARRAERMAQTPVATREPESVARPSDGDNAPPEDEEGAYRWFLLVPGTLFVSFTSGWLAGYAQSFMTRLSSAALRWSRQSGGTRQPQLGWPALLVLMRQVQGARAARAM